MNKKTFASEIQTIKKVRIPLTDAQAIIDLFFIGNRNMRWDKIHKMAEDMKNGEFNPILNSVKVLKDGTWMDGMHRLYAQLEAGVDMDYYMVVGCTKSDIPKTDIGTSRTPADVRTIVVGRDLNSERATARCNVINYIVNNASTIETLRFEDQQAIEKQFYDGLLKWNKVSLQGTGASPFSGALIVTGKKFPIEADSFAKKFVEGIGVEKGEPAHALRLFYDANANRRGQTIAEEKARKAICAIYKHIRGERGAKIYDDRYDEARAFILS